MGTLKAEVGIMEFSSGEPFEGMAENTSNLAGILPHDI